MVPHGHGRGSTRSGSLYQPLASSYPPLASRPPYHPLLQVDALGLTAHTLRCRLVLPLPEALAAGRASASEALRALLGARLGPHALAHASRGGACEDCAGEDDRGREAREDCVLQAGSLRVTLAPAGCTSEVAAAAAAAAAGLAVVVEWTHTDDAIAAEVISALEDG